MNYKVLSKITGIIGIVTLVISEVLLFEKVEPVYTWFYCFAWWSYILVVDSLVFYLRGKSLIFGRGREFFEMVPWSVAFWLFFEMVNLNLKNWHYINLPQEQWVRWPGYFIAYATVLPGIFETRDLLECFGFFKNSRVRGIVITKSVLILFTVIGTAFLFLPLIFPRYFFPLIWGGFIFLLEPALYHFQGESLLRKWEHGSFRDFYLLLLAGFICGGLWEFWNFWAKAKWVYTVPWVGNLKIFEMPVLGFLGFPPFAVEAFVMWNMVVLLKRRKILLSSLFLIPVFLTYFYMCFKAIDLFYVHSFN